MKKHSHHSAFTLVELLVVIAIIAVLIGLLLPAVQSAREAGRRITCQGNLKHNTLAVLSYEASRQTIPASIVSPDGSNPSYTDATSRNHSWVLTVLPFLEQQALQDAWVRTAPLADSANLGVRSVRLPTLLCPSDSNNTVPFMGSAGSATALLGDNWARGNYAASASLGALNLNAWDTGSTATEWRNILRRGAMGFNTASRMREITDGTSKTILLAEIRAGLTPYDNRGIWAMGVAGASSLWCFGGLTGDAYGPNCPNPFSDDMFNCDQLRTAVGGNDALVRHNMGCFGHSPAESGQATSRSMHLGGVLVSTADGAVRWISNHVNVLPSAPFALSVWDRLVLSTDGQPVSSDSL